MNLGNASKAPDKLQKIFHQPFVGIGETVGTMPVYISIRVDQTLDKGESLRQRST
jgi:hypothetical protein